MATKGIVLRSCGSFGGGTPRIPCLWNLPVKPHIRKIHRGLELLHLHTCEIPRDFFTRQAFVKRLQKLQQISRIPQHVFIREGDLDPSIDVENGILLHASPLYKR